MNQIERTASDFKMDIIKIQHILKIKKLDQNCYFQEYLLIGY